MSGFRLPNTSSMASWGMPVMGDYAPLDYSLSTTGGMPAGLSADPGVWNTPPAGGQAGGGWMSNLFSGFSNTYDPKGNMVGQGWGGAALGAANSIFNAYMGLKQYGLAKDQFAESKRQFGLNFDAQKRTTNAALADRQLSRLSADPKNYMSLADYMSKYGIQGG